MAKQKFIGMVTLNTLETMIHYEKIYVFTIGLATMFSSCNGQFATHGIYMALNVNEQVATIAIDTLCCIQFHIYGATHM